MRLLVVEDERTLARHLQKGLEEAAWTVDVAHRVDDASARRGARRIDLTAREFTVLELLMRHAGEIVTRSMLADQVWGERYDSLSNLIEVFINRLRRKIESADEPRLLHTVRGAGYTLRAD